MGSIQLDIDKKEAREYLEFLLDRRQKFINDNIDVFNTLNEYAEKIDRIQDMLELESLSEYPVGGSWNQRIRFFLDGNEDGMTARQITSLMATKEGLRDPVEVNRYYASIAPTLSAATGKLYDRTTNKNNEFVYTLKK